MNKSTIMHRITNIFQLIMLTVNRQYIKSYKKQNNIYFALHRTIHILNNAGFECQMSLSLGSINFLYKIKVVRPNSTVFD